MKCHPWKMANHSNIAQIGKKPPTATKLTNRKKWTVLHNTESYVLLCSAIFIQEVIPCSVYGYLFKGGYSPIFPWPEKHSKVFFFFSRSSVFTIFTVLMILCYKGFFITPSALIRKAASSYIKLQELYVFLVYVMSGTHKILYDMIFQ